METFGLFSAMSLLGVKLLDLVKNLQGGRLRDAMTQIGAFAVGVFVVFVAASTPWADGLQVGGVALSNINGSGLVLLGLTMSGAGQWLYDVSPRSTPSLGGR